MSIVAHHNDRPLDPIMPVVMFVAKLKGFNSEEISLDIVLYVK